MLLLFAWALAGTLGHALFLFLTASVIAFLLNPLVRAIWRAPGPRGLAVAVVYLSFAAAMIVVIVALGTVVVEQARSAADRVDAYLTDEPGQSGRPAPSGTSTALAGLARTTTGSTIQLREQATNGSTRSRARRSPATRRTLISFAQGAAFGVVQLLFSLVLIVVISIYMLLDMPKLEAAIDRRFPPHGGPPLTLRIESALAGYVRGQILLSAIIGASAGVGMWVLGVLDLVPGAERVRAAVRALDGGDRGDPVHRPVALGGAAGDLRARSSTRSRSSGWRRSSSSSTRWRGTSSCRT